ALQSAGTADGLRRTQLLHAGLEDDLDPLRRDRLVDPAPVVLEEAREGVAPIREHDPVALGEAERRLDRAVPSSDHEDLLALVLAGRVEAVGGPLPVLPRKAPPARGSTRSPRGGAPA